MSKIKVSDFYYGAVLSKLFNSGIKPALVEGDEDRQVYDFTTDNAEFRLFIKYRADKQKIKKLDYSSWVFNFTDKDRKEIIDYIDSGFNLVITLVCGVKRLANSEIVIIDKDEIRELICLGKKTLTLSRIKNERAYRISVGGGRENAKKIKTNRFEELF